MQANIKKLLIVKPPYRHIPLGIAYVLSCLERNNIPFDFIDTTFVSPDYKKLFNKNDYLAFATGGLIANFHFISETVKTIRSIKPDLPIIMGGNIVKDVNPEFLFDREMIGIDYGIIGEAETSLPYFIEKLNAGSYDFGEVPGLFFKDKSSGQIIKNNPKRFDLEGENVFPAWHHINMEFYKYSDVSYMASQVVLPVVTARGCVGVCTFCSPTIGAFRKRPISHVMEEIEFLFFKYNFDILSILNEMFYHTKEDILQFCEEYKKLKIRKPWMCGMRVDVKNLDDDTFAAMKEAGCILTGAGIESGSNKILKNMRKLTTKEQVINFYRGVKRAKLPCLGTFMIGNEGENEEDIKETIDMVINEEMNCDASLTDAYPGTQIYRNALKKGLIRDEKDYYGNVFFTPGPYNLSWRNRETYLNISDIPNDRFWSVIFNELRRFYTFLFNRFQVLNVKYKVSWLCKTVKVTGTCCECGNPIKIFSDYDLLGQLTYCPKCYSVLYVDYYKLKDFSKHFELLCKKLKSTEKLVIVGVQLQAVNILRYDHFGLNYEKIRGFFDPKEREDSAPLFAFLPRLQMKNLLNILPDTILIADDVAGNAELKLKIFYSKNKIDIPEILHLVPDEKSFSFKMIRFIDRFAAGKGLKGFIDRMIWTISAIILEFSALFPKTVLVLMQNLKPGLKRMLGAAFARKLRLLFLRYMS